MFFKIINQFEIEECQLDVDNLVKFLAKTRTMISPTKELLFDPETNPNGWIVTPASTHIQGEYIVASSVCAPHALYKKKSDQPHEQNQLNALSETREFRKIKKYELSKAKVQTKKPTRSNSDELKTNESLAKNMQTANMRNSYPPLSAPIAITPKEQDNKDKTMTMNSPKTRTEERLQDLRQRRLSQSKSFIELMVIEEKPEIATRDVNLKIYTRKAEDITSEVESIYTTNNNNQVPDEKKSSGILQALRDKAISFETIARNLEKSMPFLEIKISEDSLDEVFDVLNTFEITEYQTSKEYLASITYKKMLTAINECLDQATDNRLSTYFRSPTK